MTHFVHMALGIDGTQLISGIERKWKGSNDDNFIFQCDQIETGRLWFEDASSRRQP